jgi:hypothetical protein
MSEQCRIDSRCAITLKRMELVRCTEYLYDRMYNDDIRHSRGACGLCCPNDPCADLKAGMAKWARVHQI